MAPLETAPHVFGFPAALLLAALGGALVSALQPSLASWRARLSGLLSGFLTALFCSQAVAGVLFIGRTPGLETLIGLAFIIGCAGNVLTRELVENPWGVLRRVRRKGEGNGE